MSNTNYKSGTLDFSLEINATSNAFPFRWTILYHPDPMRIGHWAHTAPGVPASFSRLQTNFGDGRGNTRPLEAPCVSRAPLQVTPATNGGLWLRLPNPDFNLKVNGQPVSGDVQLTSEQLTAGLSIRLGRRVLLWVQRSTLFQRAPSKNNYAMVGHSAAMEGLRTELDRVVDLDIPVLIRGETGTGKELVARALHQNGPRRSKPFLPLNMAALNPSTAAGELFGHAKGAFTGANRDKAGYFTQAHGGTLFLDEIGELPRPLQALLLRVLETGEVQRVGGGHPQKVDVRMLSATDAPLESDCDAGQFSMPLFQRLNGYELRLPPLRERRQDIPMLLRHFLQEILQETGELHRLLRNENLRQDWMSPRDMMRLVHHDWPGNIRELRNVARKMAVYSRQKPILELPPGGGASIHSAQAAPQRTPTPQTSSSTRPPTQDISNNVADSQEFDLQTVKHAMRANKWSLRKASMALGVSRSTLYRWIESSPDLRTAADLSAEEIAASIHANGGDLRKAAEHLEVSHRGLQRRMTALKMKT